MFYVYNICNSLKNLYLNNYNNQIKLNPLIFNDVLLLLIKDCKSFNQLIEYSIISKSSFKTIQYYLTHKPEYINYYTNYFNILNYITKNQFHKYNKNDIININNYKYRLIQYQEIQVLFIRNCHSHFEQLNKSTLIDICGCDKLKQVIILDEYYQVTSYLSNLEFDTQFIKFNKLYLYWDNDQHQPKSNKDEEAYILTDEYSLDHLKEHNPKKLKITTADIHSGTDLQIQNLNNLLYHCKELESIDFEYHDTPLEFYKLIVESLPNSIKSFSVRLDSQSLKSLLTIDNNNNSIHNNNNNSLNKLKFKPSINERISNKSPSTLLQHLVNNSNNYNKLNKLGLELFKITKQNYKSLSLLLKLPNISTIYCNSSSTESFLQHCLENPNIHTLEIVNDGQLKLHGKEEIFTNYLKMINGNNKYNTNNNYSNKNNNNNNNNNILKHINLKTDYNNKNKIKIL